MLAELYVENFALIENIQVTFHEGLNVISGETGAGKSLLTDAVGLLMGGRADKDFIGTGAKKALVEGTFIGPFRGVVLEQFAAAGFSLEDDIVISREINEEGANLCRINSRRVSLSILKDLVPLLMNLHSQAEHFIFLKEDYQLSIIDRFGSEAISPFKEVAARTYSLWQEAHKRAVALSKQNKEAAEKADFLEYRVRELSEIDVKPHEDETLREEITLMKTATKRLSDSSDLYQKLTLAVENLYEAMLAGKALGSLDAGLKDKVEVLNAAYYDVEDIKESIATYRNEIEADPRALDRCEERLSRISRLKKKYQTDTEGLIATLEEAKVQLESITDFDYHMEKLAKEEALAKEAFVEVGDELTAARQKVGNALSKDIMEELRDLMLPNAQFQVAIKEASFSPQGKDDVAFLISMNRGEALKSLAKVASGGEISRILLAMKVILGKIDGVQTMIFDEIDSGMGGKAATKVGEKLSLLAKDIQVFAVTHSPIVAAKAQHHYYIEKTDFFDKTIVEIRELKEEERTREVARMVSGNEKSETSLRQAAELLSSE